MDKAKKIFYSVTPRLPYDHTMTLCLPYFHELNKLIIPLKILGIKLIYKYTDTLLVKLIRNSPRYEEASIYAIKCNCNKFYIGQTTITVQKRTAQHYQYIVKNVESSALNLHYRVCDKGIVWNSPITITHVNDYFSRNMLETLLIKFTWNNNVNLSLGPISSDKILLYIASRDLKFKQLLETRGVCSEDSR